MMRSFYLILDFDKPEEDRRAVIQDIANLVANGCSIVAATPLNNAIHYWLVTPRPVTTAVDLDTIKKFKQQ